jgi:hypothetical protein
MPYHFDMNTFQATIAKAGGLAKPNRFQVFFNTASLGQNSTKIFNLIENNAFEKNTKGVSADWMSDFYDADLQATNIELSAFCEKSQLPSYQFQLETVRHYGPPFKIPHMPEYQDMTMTFICGAKMWERYFFEAWMYMIMDPVTNNFNYKNEYAIDVDIVQYNEYETSESVDYAGFYNSLAFNRSIEANSNLNGAYPGKLNAENFTNIILDCNYWTTLVDCFPIAINEQELGYDMNNTFQRLQVTFSYKFAVPFDDKTSTTGIGMTKGGTRKFQDTISTDRPNNPPQT